MKWSTKETYIVCKVLKTVNWHRYAGKSGSVGAGSLTSLNVSNYAFASSLHDPIHRHTLSESTLQL